MDQRQIPWLALVGILVATIAGCSEDEDTQQPQFEPPAACFTATPDSGTVETIFLLDASCTSDEETPAAVLEVRWDWEDDGTWDTEWSTAKVTTHQFTTEGTKTVRLQVRDTEGLTADTTRSVEVD